MNCLSKIKPYDIFYSRRTKHYYICVYTQKADVNNPLVNDIYGLIITTNPKYRKLLESNKNDYNVEIKLNKKRSYVCCDKLSRMKNDKNIILKPFSLKENEVNEIEKNLNKFISEMKRQIRSELK